MEFQVRVDDNASPRPQPGWSQKGYVRVADFEAAHADAARRWLGLEHLLSKLGEKEAEMRRLAERAAQDPAAAQAERGQREALEGQLAQQWEAAAKFGREFSQALDKDAYANPGVAEEARAMASALENAASRELPRAREASRSGDFPQAAQRHARLEAQARHGVRRLEEGRTMQSLQDFWSEADRLDQAGSELSRSLAGLAKGGKPSAEDRRKLDEALGKLQEQMEELAKAIASLPKAPQGSSEEKGRKQYEVPLGAAQRSADALAKALAAGDFAAAARLAQQLADQLAKVRQAVGDAAREQAGGMAGGQEDPLSGKMAQAGAAFNEVIEEQTRSLSLAQKLEDAKTPELLAAQTRLLERLAERQAAAVADARGLGSRMPQDALHWMEAALSELRRKALSQAPEHLRRTIARLGAQAAAQPEGGAPLEALAKAEREILEELSRGAQPPPPTPERLSEATAAGAAQRQVRRKTEALGERIEELAREAGGLPGGIREPLDAALKEQQASEEALGKADSGKAVGHEQAALEHLERSRKALSDAAEQQTRVEGGLRQPFDRPGQRLRRAGGGGRAGADTGFVPLPSAKDYQPPRELRQELERSSQERRPPAYDPVIKEYLRRMSE